MTRIVAFVPGTDFRYGHKALQELAMKEHKINTDALNPGDFVVFVNNARNGIKLLTSGGVLVYRKNKGAISLDTISFIPRFFNGVDFNLKGTIRAAVMKALGKKG